MIGPLLSCNIYPIISLVKKDGSVEADIVYANMSDAMLALGLSQCQLGDRTFVVQLEVENEKRLNLLSTFHPKTSLFAHNPQDCKTLIVNIQSGGEGVNKSTKSTLNEEELLQVLIIKTLVIDSVP